MIDINNPLKLCSIVYDIDDVLADFWKTALPLFNKEFNKDLKLEEITSYNNFLEGSGITKEEFMNFLKYRIPFGEIQPTPYVDLMNAQYRHGHKISIVTSRDYLPDADLITRKWLKSVGALYHDLYISGKKKKSDFFPDVVDVVYDDHSMNIDHFLDSGILIGTGFIVDKPWNRNYKREGVIRKFLKS